jgi:hypothetical protein
VLRAEKQNEIPSIYIMKRWEKRCKKVYTVWFQQYSNFPFLFYFVQ